MSSFLPFFFISPLLAVWIAGRGAAARTLLLVDIRALASRVKEIPLVSLNFLVRDTMSQKFKLTHLPNVYCAICAEKYPSRVKMFSPARLTRTSTE